MRREIRELPDGDFVEVDVLEAPAGAAHVLVLHGLEGSSRSGYVGAILAGVARRGWGALALNFRSCGDLVNRLPRSYHAGDTADVAHVLASLRARTTGPLFAVGFSLGGNVLCRLLAEQGEASPLVAAVSISAPYDLLACARALDRGRGVGIVYRYRFLRALRAKAIVKARRHPGLADLAAIRASRGIEAFDHVFTGPVHGFAGSADYYARASSAPRLGEIRRPTLLLTAADDPFVPGAAFPREAAAANPCLTVVLTEQGGHVGFVAGSILRPVFWAEERALAFLDAAR